MRWFVIALILIIAVISINAYEKIGFSDLEKQLGNEVVMSGFIIEVENDRYLVQNPMKMLCCQDNAAPPIKLQIEVGYISSYRRREVKGVLDRDESGFILR